MAKYDTLQVCLNGHSITDRYYDSSHRRQDYCNKCGAKTIIECQECGEEIEGDRLDSSVLIVSTKSAPDYCENCGTPFPWTQKPDEDELIGVHEAIEQGETEDIEFKEEIDSIRDISKELVALANHKGGVLLLGVNDDGKVEGLPDVDKAEERVSNHVRQSIDPAMNPTIRKASINAEQVLSIQVPRASEKPYNLNGTFYIRAGTGIDKLSTDELMEWTS